jgi:hypothetical protein
MANVGTKILDFLKKGYPFIATGLSLAGPAGNLAAGILKTTLSLTDSQAGNPADPQKVTQALNDLTLTPDQRTALAQAEMQYQEAALQMGYKSVADLEALSNADRDSARNLQIKTGSRVPGMLAITITLGFFAVVTFMLLRSVPQSGHDALMLILGSLASAWVSVVAYYFGSSKGSADKTQLLAQAPPISQK